MIDAHVAQLRRIVVGEVGEETARARAAGPPPLDPVDRRQMARSILRRELDGQWRAAQQRGEMTLTPEEEDRIVEAVPRRAVLAAARGSRPTCCGATSPTSSWSAATTSAGAHDRRARSTGSTRWRAATRS